MSIIPNDIMWAVGLEGFHGPIKMAHMAVLIIKLPRLKFTLKTKISLVLSCHSASKLGHDQDNQLTKLSGTRKFCLLGLFKASIQINFILLKINSLLS